MTLSEFLECLDKSVLLKLCNKDGEVLYKGEKNNIPKDIEKGSRVIPYSAVCEEEEMVVYIEK